MQPDAAKDRVQPADRLIASFLAAVRTRTLAQHACEALLAGAVGALLVSLLLLRHLAIAPLSGVSLAVAAIGIGGWIRLRGSARLEPALVAQTEARQPALRNLLVTERELARMPDRGRALIRARVLHDTARVIGDTHPATIIPNPALIRPLVGALIIGGLALGLVIAHDRSHADTAAHAQTGATAATGADDAVRVATGDIRTVTVTVTPPPYVGRPAVTLVNPSSVEALAGSRLALSIDASAPAVEREIAGDRRPLARDAAAQPFTDTVVVQDTAVLTLTATNGDARQPIELARRLIAVAVTPDQPPAVRLARPGKDLLFGDNTARVTIQAEATDDFGLGALTLHYTKVTGSGERYEFTEGEIPIAVARSDARAWQGETTRTLASLQINEGDTFVYYAAATDRRPGQARAVSDSYVIEIGKAGAAIAGGFAIPPDEDKSALSLNALIQKTEKLHARRTTMPAAAFADASAALAIEQRMVKNEFLFSMGTHGHVEDEEQEAGNSDEIQAGRLENRGQAELTAATRFMTRAEQDLTDAQTGPALQAQRAALAAVQKALSRQRYFLRTLAVGGTIDPTRRLTGDLSTATPGARADATPVDRAKATALRSLLRTLSALAGGVPTAGGSAGDTARVAAGRLLAIDPASPSLRTASDRLLQAARELDGDRADAARPLVQEAANALLPLMRDVAAPAALDAAAAPRSGADRGLRGASVDALRRTGGAP